MDRRRACARGRIVYCIDGPSEAHRTHNRQNGRGAAANCSLARSGWRNPSFKAPAERYSSRTNACADWRHRHYYEARPEVTIDASALCLKAGNAAILRGSRHALQSNRALAHVVSAGLEAAGLPANAVQLVTTPERAAVEKLATMTQYIDLIVPRGGRGLIEALMACARVPMIKHLDGVCHVYIDDAADLEKARAICDNAKTQRFGVCNAMETLLVARGIAAAALPLVCQTLRNKNVELRACPQSDAILENAGVGPR